MRGETTFYAGRANRRAHAALAALLLTSCATAALAQAGPNAAAKAAAAPEDEATLSEVVVTATREQPGAAVGDIKPELQLSPAEIQSYGVSNLSQLLDEIAPQTRSERGRGGEAPVILLAGRRISGFNEIRDIPTEAVLRVDVLPEEAALKYGYSANQRVVNFVLRPFFRARTVEGGAGYATEGGQAGGSAELGYLQIRRDQRLNLNLRVSGQAALTEDERDLVSRTSGQGFDPAGNVLPARGASQIDPALPVAIAGIPAAAGSRPLTLSDFAAPAGVPNTSAVGQFRTLLPSSRAASLNAVYSRPLPADVQASFNGTLEAKHSESLQGLPNVSLAVPADDPFSPFSEPVTVARSATSFGPLRQTTDSWSAHAGASFNRDVQKWRLSLTTAYDHSDVLTRSDTGLDAAPLQARLSASDPAFNPFAPLPEDQLIARAQDKARSMSKGLNIQLLANGPLIDLPAGPLFASVKLGDTGSWFSSDSQRALLSQSVDLSRNDLNGQLSLDVPLTSRRNDVLAAIGDLSVNLNANVNHLSDFGTMVDVGYGLNWRPLTQLTLLVSQTREEGAPSFTQLGGPVVITPGTRIFDYVTGQTVDVRSVTGGNPALNSDARRVTKVGLTFKPLQDQELTFTANYVRSKISNPIAIFPAVTSEIEQAFPLRFVRDPQTGQLTQVDLRPVNFASEETSSLRWGVNFMKRLGPQPAPGALRARGGPDSGPPGPRGGQGGGRGGGRGFGGPGGGPFGGGPPPTMVQFAIYHTVHFKDEVLMAPGGPRLDFLNGDAAGNSGGQPEHEIEAQAGLTKNGFGARLSAKWQSGTEVRGDSSPGTNLTFSDLAKVDLRLFADLNARRDLVTKYPFFRGSRVSFAVTNLFDQRISVHDATGATPISYQSAYLDPVGRKVSVSFRKLFFPPPPAVPPAQRRS